MLKIIVFPVKVIIQVFTFPHCIYMIAYFGKLILDHSFLFLAVTSVYFFAYFGNPIRLVIKFFPRPVTGSIWSSATLSYGNSIGRPGNVISYHSIIGKLKWPD